jgi:hypothetical protein
MPLYNFKLLEKDAQCNELSKERMLLSNRDEAAFLSGVVCPALLFFRRGFYYRHHNLLVDLKRFSNTGRLTPI